MKSLFILALLVFTSASWSQVYINEYSCSNVNGSTDAFGDRNDWVELYNPGGSAVDLTGYFLSDRSTNLDKWEIPAGATVPAGGYTMIRFSGRGIVSGGEIHPTFGLTQTRNEWIILCTPSLGIVDSLYIKQMTQADHSMGRTTDGAATWSLFMTPTYNSANTGANPYYTAKPVMSVAAGFYGGAQNVTITSTDGSATIYYTTDGSVPTTGSNVYAGPVNISANTVLRARAFSSTPGVPPSFVETNSYFIGTTHSVPVLSICGDEIMDFLNNSAPGSFNNDFVGAWEYFDANGAFIDEGTGDFNKHGNDSWAYGQRGFDLVARDEFGINNAINHPIFQNKSRDSYQRLIVKAAANDNYSFEDGAHLRDAFVHTISDLGDLRMDERTSKFGVVYVDGQYWGLYDFREKVDDHDFTEYYYDQGKYDIDFIKTWGATWAEYGDMVLWDQLYTFITSNDMSDPVNYEIVKDSFNVGSLIDYTVLNSYIVASDWLNWNTAWWRGRNPEGDKKKWRYVLWDMDASFGHYINYTGVPSTAPDADPCNPEGLSGGSDPEGHMNILNALMANEEFNQEYITRYADLSNGIFSCESMHHILDSMVAVLAPEMQAQCDRWGGSVADWQSKVQELKDYIDARCAAFSDGMIDCYDLTGPFDLVVNVEPAGAGRVKVNSEWVPFYSWTGIYYGNINTLFKADAFPGYEFDYWESTNHTFAYADSLVDTLDLTQNDSIIAHFKVVEDPPDPPEEPEEPTANPNAGFAGFHVPNAFSPNADNKNDMLAFFVGHDIEYFTLMIFDRWGNLVFQTSTVDDFWNGYYKGKLVNTGVYTYTLEYESTETGSNKVTGNITVMR